MRLLHHPGPRASAARPGASLAAALAAALGVALGVAAPLLPAQDRGARPPERPEARVEARASFDSAWAAVARTYWDTTLVHGRWRAVHDSLRATLAPDAPLDEVRDAIRALIAVPGQSHFVLLPESASPVSGSTTRTPGTIGLEVRTVGGAVLAWRVAPGGPADRAGIRPGDRLLRAGTFVVDSAARALRASTTDEATARRLLTTAVMSRLMGSAGDSVNLALAPARGRPRTVTVARGPLQGLVTRFGNLPAFAVTASATPLALDGGRSAIVIRFNAWFPVLGPRLDSLLFAHREAAGVVIDLRGNTGGVIGMIAGVAGHFLDSAVSLGELRSRGNIIRFSANPRLVRPSGERVRVYAGPVAILVDELTASTSEFFASGMQALGRARVFGGQSAGQALPAAMGRLPSGDVLMHVIADHEDAGGRRVEGRGIAPDTRVPLTRRDLQAGRDATLDAARRWIARGAP